MPRENKYTGDPGARKETFVLNLWQYLTSTTVNSGDYDTILLKHLIFLKVSLLQRGADHENIHGNYKKKQNDDVRKMS